MSDFQKQIKEIENKYKSALAKKDISPLFWKWLWKMGIEILPPIVLFKSIAGSILVLIIYLLMTTILCSLVVIPTFWLLKMSIYQSIVMIASVATVTSVFSWGRLYIIARIKKI